MTSCSNGEHKVVDYALLFFQDMKKKRTVAITFIIMLCAMLNAQNTLLYELQRITDKAKAQTGVAVIIDGKDTLTVNNDYHYPMMSVFKFHQALAVADHMQHHGLSLDTRIYISKEDMIQNTYSPMRDRYPHGNIYLPISELLRYTLQLSDNIACDVLFRLIGGPSTADKYIRSLCVNDFSITANEDDMHRDLTLCHSNWSTPLSAAKLLETFLKQDTVNNKPLAFVHAVMTGCKTGINRLSRPLIESESKTVIGHKTGTSDTDAQGRIIAINDIGFILLPNGHRYTIAVFVANSEETMEDTEKIIGDISEAVLTNALYDVSLSEHQLVP